MRYIFISLLFSIQIAVSGQSIYNFQLQTPEGKLLQYSEIKGSKVTVIDFWATWCKPCVNSIPKLVELYNSYSPEEVAFIAVSIDSPRNLNKIRPFAESVGINYPVLLDTDQEVMKDLNITVIPTLVVVNAENEVLLFHEGFAPGDEKLLKQEIDEILAK